MWVLEGFRKGMALILGSGEPLGGFVRKDCLLILCSKSQGKASRSALRLPSLGLTAEQARAGSNLSGCLKWPTASYIYSSAVGEEAHTPSWVLPGLPALWRWHTRTSVYTQHGIFLWSLTQFLVVIQPLLGEFHFCGIPERLGIREEC